MFIAQTPAHHCVPHVPAFPTPPDKGRPSRKEQVLPLHCPARGRRGHWPSQEAMAFRLSMAESVMLMAGGDVSVGQDPVVGGNEGTAADRSTAPGSNLTTGEKPPAPQAPVDQQAPKGQQQTPRDAALEGTHKGPAQP